MASVDSILKTHDTYVKLETADKTYESAIAKTTDPAVKQQLEDKQKEVKHATSRFERLHAMAISKGWKAGLKDNASTYQALMTHLTTNGASVDLDKWKKANAPAPVANTSATPMKKSTKNLLRIGAVATGITAASSIYGGIVAAGNALGGWGANTSLLGALGGMASGAGSGIATAASWVCKTAIPAMWGFSPLVAIGAIGMVAVGIPLALKGLKKAAVWGKNFAVKTYHGKKAKKAFDAAQQEATEQAKQVSAIEAQIRSGAITMKPDEIDLLPYDQAQKDILKKAVGEYDQDQKVKNVSSSFETSFVAAVENGSTAVPLPKDLRLLDPAVQKEIRDKAAQLHTYQIVHTDHEYATEAAEAFANYEKAKKLADEIDAFKKATEASKTGATVDATTIEIEPGKTIEQVMQEAVANNTPQREILTKIKNASGLAGLEMPDGAGGTKPADSTVKAAVIQVLVDYAQGYQQNEKKKEAAADMKSPSDYLTTVNDSLKNCTVSELGSGLEAINPAEIGTAGTKSDNIAQTLRAIQGLNATERDKIRDLGKNAEKTF